MINRDLDKIEIPDNIDEFIDKGINKLKREKEEKGEEALFKSLQYDCNTIYIYNRSNFLILIQRVQVKEMHLKVYLSILKLSYYRIQKYLILKQT